VSLYSCSYEHELTAALQKARWPEACTPELRTHVETCPHCKELLLVARAFQRARREALPQARLVSPSLIWWRAQLRQRNEAMERAAKPIAVVETLALVGTLLAVVALAVGMRADFTAWLYDSGGLTLLKGLWPAESGTSLATVLLAGTATLGLLGALAAYLVVRNE
jgi:predicted anti-sigma-YlaC factor YlaD